MAFIQDILNLFRKGPEFLGQIEADRVQNKSVARGAHDSTMQFPVLMSDTIPIDMAGALTRFLERRYAGFVQTWISMNQTVDLSLDPTPMSYLKKFHQNVRLEKTLEDLTIDREDVPIYMEKVYSGEYKLYLNKEKTYGVLFNTTDKNLSALMESNKDLLKEHMSEFNLDPIDVSVFNEADSNFTTAGDLANVMLDNEIADRKLREQKLRSDLTDKRSAPQLLDRDVKKSNDLMPFAMQVRLIGVNKDKNFVQYLDFILGVKCVMHLIRSDDMVDQLVNSLKNRDAMFRFIRWTTGELSLFKNLILNLDDIKIDAMTTRQSGKSPWFSKLRKLKQKKFNVRNLTIPTKLVPNSTVVVSEYEINDIKNKIGLNLRDPSIAKKLMDDLFLMSFVVIDDSTNTIDIMEDSGANDFETYTLESIQREVSLTSNKLGREIGRMISSN